MPCQMHTTKSTSVSIRLPILTGYLGDDRGIDAFFLQAAGDGLPFALGCAGFRLRGIRLAGFADRRRARSAPPSTASIRCSPRLRVRPRIRRPQALSDDRRRGMARNSAGRGSVPWPASAVPLSLNSKMVMRSVVLTTASMRPMFVLTSTSTLTPISVKMVKKIVW
jgi:hypothetical protein